MDKFTIDLDKVLDDFEKVYDAETERSRSASDLTSALDVDSSESSGYDSLRTSSELIGTYFALSNANGGVCANGGGHLNLPPTLVEETASLPTPTKETSAVEFGGVNNSDTSTSGQPVGFPWLPSLGVSLGDEEIDRYIAEAHNHSPNSTKPPPAMDFPTPSEDVGFSRVPGFSGGMLPPMVQEELQAAPTHSNCSSVNESPSHLVPPKKKARPNSLLGLSIPAPPSENFLRVRREVELAAPPRPTSPMDCYEEIENPLYQPITPTATPTTLTSRPRRQPVGTGLRRPCSLPIPPQGLPITVDQPSPNEASLAAPARSSRSSSSSVGSEEMPAAVNFPGSATSSTTMTPGTDTASDSTEAPMLLSPSQQDLALQSPSVGSVGSGSHFGAGSTWTGIAEEEIGRREPTWARDDSSPTCMTCTARFTVWRRRHHCRACGRLLCGQCCTWKMRLDFLRGGPAKARVCATCYQHLVRLESSQTRSGGTPLASSLPGPISQPPASALKRARPTSVCSGGPTGASSAVFTPSVPPPLLPPLAPVVKTVTFSDGIRPGGDLTELSGSSPLTTPTRPTRGGFLGLRGRGDQHQLLGGPSSSGVVIVEECLIPLPGKYPPLVVQTSGELLLDRYPTESALASHFDPANQDEGHQTPPGIVFAVTRNLHIHCRLVRLSCCVDLPVWCFASSGLDTVGQEEVVIVLKQAGPEEVLPPLDVLQHYYQLYQEAATSSNPEKKSPFSDLSCLLTPGGLFGQKDVSGYLYFRPTHQCLCQLPLPEAPFLIGLLIHRWEAPWAKLFPLRLLLRLGKEARYYPCPVVSERDRGPVFAEVGHTVLQLLADFRDFRYTLPVVPGLRVHMARRETTILIPKSSYAAVMKVVSERSSEEHQVVAFGAGFSQEADSHLVCLQNDDGQYVTQAISIENTERTLTGASFVVFNGSQRDAGSRIVEDGLIVQLSQGQLQHLIAHLKAAQPVTFKFQQPTAEVSGADCRMGLSELQSEIEGEEEEACSLVSVVWMEGATVGTGSMLAAPPRVSWVDNRPLTSLVTSTSRVPPDHQLTHWTRTKQLLTNGASTGGSSTCLRLAWVRCHVIRCPADCEEASSGEPVDTGRIGDELASACVAALAPHITILRASDLTRLAVRAVLDSDNVSYEVGACPPRPPLVVAGLPTPHQGATLTPCSVPMETELVSAGVAVAAPFPLPQYCLNDLDTALVPILHPRASQIRGGPVVVEVEFCLLD